MSDTYLIPTQEVSKIGFVATVALMVLLFISLIFPLLIVAKIIPFDIIWGGKIKDDSQMLLYETFSVIINILMILVIALRAKIIKSRISRNLIKAFVFIMLVIFSLNTIGNFTSENQFEKNIFTPLTFLLASLCFVLFFNKERNGDRQ